MIILEMHLLSLKTFLHKFMLMLEQYGGLPQHTATTKLMTFLRLNVIFTSNTIIVIVILNIVTNVIIVIT